MEGDPVAELTNEPTNSQTQLLYNETPQTCQLEYRVDE
jgi:hypothetical protein